MKTPAQIEAIMDFSHHSQARDGFCAMQSHIRDMLKQYEGYHLAEAHAKQNAKAWQEQARLAHIAAVEARERF
jgi:predicted HAD superfamily hydrolase